MPDLELASKRLAQPWSEQGEVREVNLQPGELFFAREPTIIRTLLGSCVGATFWSVRVGAGGLFHAQLPSCPGAQVSGAQNSAGNRYVDFSIRNIARQFDKLGVGRAEVQVKLFGGADVLPSLSKAGSRPTVGRQNLEAATSILRAEGFQVAASCVGGKLGMKIAFNTRTGEVLLRRLG